MMALEDLLLEKMKKQRKSETKSLFQIQFLSVLVKSINSVGLFVVYIITIYFYQRNGGELHTAKMFVVLWYLWQIMKLFD